MVAAPSYSDTVFFGFTILFIFFALLISCVIGYWLTRRAIGHSPYTGQPLRRATTLSLYSRELVLKYLYSLHQYDNRVFDFEYAAICRETGRIFPNVVTWYDMIHVDWSFIQKRFPGQFVSWGSLSDEQQQALRSSHHSLEGFQTEFSSRTPSPRLVEKEYIFMKPGPLYVDIESKVLLGWKIVPETELEVLIIQRPKGIFDPQK